MSTYVNKFIGNPVNLIDIREGSDSLTGRFVEYVFAGTASGMQSVANSYAPIAKQILVTGVGPKKVLTVRFDRDPELGALEEPKVEFRFIPNEHHKDILESELAAGLDDDEIRKIREAINNSQGGVSPALQTPQGISLYQLMLKGVRSVPLFQPTCVMVRTAASAWQWVGRPTNVGRIYSEAGMLAEMTDLSGYTPSFNQALPDLTTARTDAGYGWRKKMPSYDQVAGGHTQETIEYEYGLWSNDVYDDAT